MAKSKIDRLIDKGENTMLLAGEDFEADVRLIERKILREVEKILNEIDAEGGRIRSSEKAIQFLNSLEKRIDAALKDAGYQSHVNKYLKNFDVIKRNNLELHSALNKTEIAASALNDLTRLEVENTIHKLLGSGISRDFKIPIREALYRNITLGGTIQETRTILEDFILSGDKPSRLLRYTTQVARDSINQYDGSIQTIIKNELRLSDFIYSGSIIRDSRCQCRYWVNKIKLDGEELADEIETALNGGSLGGCTCSGMIPGTTVENFAVNRGGYSCRHRAIATNL